MSEICEVLSSLVQVIERDGHRPLLYAAGGASMYGTEPAPYLELVYMESGGIPALRMGEESFTFPAGHVALHNVHFGNKAPVSLVFRAKCIFFDLRAYRAFDFLEERPFFAHAGVAHPEALGAAMDRLVIHNRLAAWQPAGYPVPGDFLERRARTSPGLAPRLFIKSALLEILALALESWSADGGGIGMPPPVRRALDCIHLAYDRHGLSLGDIAEAACVDLSHLGRMFRAATGSTPMRYLRSVRVAHAAILLEQTSLPLAAIADATGFINQFLFSRIFTREYGHSPSARRRMARDSGATPVGPGDGLGKGY